MSKQIEISIREAVPDDAKELLEVMNLIRQESDFLTMDETDVSISVQEEQEHLANLYDSENNVLLLALADDKIIGTLSIHADFHRRIRHIGEIGVSILKEYWGMGLGTVLVEEAMEWAKESKVIRRLQLTVQERNTRAVHVYEKLGFVKEGLMQRGAIDANGEFLNVFLMSKMIDLNEE